MALLWLDSFDHYATADIATKYSVPSNVSILPTGGRRSSGALRPTSSLGQATTPTFTAPSSTVLVGVAVSAASLANTCSLFFVRSAGSVQLFVGFFATTGLLFVSRGAWGGTLLGTATAGPLVAGTFAFIELKTVIHPSAGSVVLRVNEVVVLTLTGLNTAATGVASWDNVRLGEINTGTTVTFDDLYLLDGSGAAPLNDLLGDCRVDARYPTAAGATTGWTPSTGANWQNVDDATPNGDTDYNSTPTVGVTDTFVTQDAPVAGATLYGVQVVVSAKKTAPGTCSVAPVIRHSGTDYPGTAGNPSTTYGYFITPYGTNPGTGAAWTEAGFNAAEFGYKRTA